MIDRIRKAAKALDDECGKLFQWPEGMTDAQEELRSAVAELAERDELSHAAERAIFEANNLLFDVCHGDHEHQIECHADRLPELYRDLAVAAEKALKILSAVVLDVIERDPDHPQRKGLDHA